MTLLELFDEFTYGRLRGLGENVGRALFTFWLGSGISRDKVPAVRDLIVGVAEHLRSHLHAGDLRFEEPLDRLIKLAGPSDDETRQIDFAKPVSSWPIMEVFLDRLEPQYAKILDIDIDGEARDYVLWTAASLCFNYARAGMSPDVTHLLLGMLVLEGVAPFLVTSNWDALIEAAVARLSCDETEVTLGVRITPDDFRQEAKRAILLKMHGCAAMACVEEAKYRALIIGRESQITGWIDDNRDSPMFMKLLELATTRKSLILGMSGQDSNIQHVFRAGANRMHWEWPDDPAACMLAAPKIEADHRVILEQVYREAYAGGQKIALEQAAVIGDFAGPVLFALLACVKGLKVKALFADCLAGAYADAEVDELAEGVNIALRSIIVGALLRIEDIEKFIEFNAHVMSVFKTGVGAEAPPHRYVPIAEAPTHMLAIDTVRGSRYPELATFVAIVGAGLGRGLWSFQLAEPRTKASPTLLMKTTDDWSRVFVVSGMDAGIRLYSDGTVGDAEEDVLIIYADAVPPTTTRTPTSVYGRSGTAETRRVGLGSIIREHATVSEMLLAFQSSAQL
jgi:SIR2-like domain